MELELSLHLHGMFESLILCIGSTTYIVPKLPSENIVQTQALFTKFINYYNSTVALCWSTLGSRKAHRLHFLSRIYITSFSYRGRGYIIHIKSFWWSQESWAEVVVSRATKFTRGHLNEGYQNRFRAVAPCLPQ